MEKYKNQTLKNQKDYTDKIPLNYFVESKNKGKITKIKYPSKDYTKNDKPITKEAYV